jgi:hypothetical protein
MNHASEAGRLSEFYVGGAGGRSAPAHCAEILTQFRMTHHMPAPHAACGAGCCTRC